jgi:hypothetical protein
LCWLEKTKKTTKQKNIIFRFAKGITEIMITLSDEAEASSAGAHLAKE